MVSFRVYKYVVTGDIEKMFHQVYVPEKQRDSLSLLWYEENDLDKAVVVYRNKSQMFGGVWSPSASMYAMEKTAMDFGSEYDPIVAKTIKGNFYVDDLLKSILSISIGIKLIRNLRSILSRASFNLIKLGSNSIEILEQIPEELRSKNYDAIEFVIDADVQDKTLGSLWRPGQDCFGFTSVPTNKPCTRRGLLSTYSSIYDPLGFVGPFVLVAKMLIQELCRLKLPWDQQLDEEYVTSWLLWRDQIPELKSFTVNRWLEVTEEPGIDYQLHLFSDASELGYGVAAYLCLLGDDGQIQAANLVMSKSRVAPLQAMTIPRLELTAAVTAAKLETKLVEYLDIPLLPSVFWVDSQIVLYYIKQQSRGFKTFVANRIALIQDLTEPEQWRFVPGCDNIADVASRGCTVNELLNNSSWLKGPSFLYDTSKWPEPMVIDDKEFVLERKTRVIKVCFSRMKSDQEEMFTRFMNCFSQWNKLIRAVATLKRLLQARKGERAETGRLTVEEYLVAESVIVGHVQQISITEKQLKSRVFTKLFPFDNEGVLRVGGRLLMSNLRFEEKHPVIFPKSQQATMYIRHVHARLGHPGVDRTYMEVRKYYWLLGGRRYVKEVLNECVLCRRLKSAPMTQQMAPLPKHRVEPGVAPFEHIGVDYCGPISVKIGRSYVKRYICVITCFQTRAMHLEMAGDLSTSSFMNALQRFISRRGKPKTITSDNGTNFVGANREIRQVFNKWNENQIHDYLIQQHIDWKFNTPGASHHGGVWERQIRSIRNLMLSLVQEQVLSDESLNTYLCVIEEIVNSRPLTKVNEDSQDLLPLTPNHLLMLRQTTGLLGDYELADTLQKRWRQLQYLADLFWKKWSRTYMRDLQMRAKWVDKTESIKVGDLVLMVDRQLPRINWPLAIVLEVFPGRDGLIRSVKVKSKEGTYERPISKLVSLECT